MEITYKRKHDDSFMIIEAPKEVVSYEERMIEENDISNLLEISKMNFDGTNFNWYKISKMEALNGYLEGVDFNKDFFEKFLIYLHLGLEEISKYLIDSSHILLSAETLFIKNKGEGFEMYFCFMGDDRGSLQEQFRMLMEYFLTILPDDDKSFQQAMYEVYELCLKDDYTLMELVEHLNECEKQSMKIEVESVNLTEKNEEVYEKNEALKIDGGIEGSSYQDDFIKSSNRECLADLFEEEDEANLGDSIKNFFERVFTRDKSLRVKDEKIMEDFIVEPDIKLSEPTVLLKEADAKCMGKLVYEGDKVEENFVINQETFRIGSRLGKNQGIINSKAVSRNHAKIIHTEEGYFIEDLNSTNGTRLNGIQLNYREPKKLKPMDSILFADAAYVFM